MLRVILILTPLVLKQEAYYLPADSISNLNIHFVSIPRVGLPDSFWLPPGGLTGRFAREFFCVFAGLGGTEVALPTQQTPHKKMKARRSGRKEFHMI